MRIMQRTVKDDFCAMQMAEAMEQCGLQVFAIAVSQVEPTMHKYDGSRFHVYARLGGNEFGREVCSEVDDLYDRLRG